MPFPVPMGLKYRWPRPGEERAQTGDGGESLSTAKMNLKGYASILYAMIMLGANVDFCGRVYFSQRGIYMFVCWIN